MRRILVALCAVLALALGLAACGGSSGGGSTSASTSAPASSSSGGGVEIKMQNIQFAPKDTTVKVGQKVTWTNDDSVDHNVTATKGAKFMSQAFGGGKTYSFTPRKPGTISYVCTLHPGMAGKLIVKG